MVNRRTFLGSVTVAASVTGCFAPGGNAEDQDLVVRNEDDIRHNVVVECTETEEFDVCHNFDGAVSATLDPGESHRVEEVFKVTDYTYRLLLSIEIDGDAVEKLSCIGYSTDPIRAVVTGSNEVSVHSPECELPTETPSPNGTATNGTASSSPTNETTGLIPANRTDRQ